MSKLTERTKCEKKIYGIMVKIYGIAKCYATDCDTAPSIGNPVPVIQKGIRNKEKGAVWSRERLIGLIGLIALMAYMQQRRLSHPW